MVMAFSMQISKQVYGREIFFESGYCVITDIQIDINNQATVYVSAFDSPDKIHLLFTNSHQFEMDVSDNGVNPKKQAYTFLKTQPEYTDANHV